MQCPHGMGLGHLAIDLIVLIPFVGAFIYWIKCKCRKEKNNG